MKKQGFREEYTVHVLVIVLSVLLIIPIIYCFLKEWTGTAFTMTVLTVISLGLGIKGLQEEIKVCRKADEEQAANEQRQKEAEEEERRLESLKDYALVEEICTALRSHSSLDNAKKILAEKSSEARKLTLDAAFNRLLNDFLEDKFVDDDEEAILQQFISQFKYTGKLITSNKQYSVFTKICQLKHFLKGEPLIKSSSIGEMVNLQRGEQIIYEEFMVDYYEDLKGNRMGSAAYLISHPYEQGQYYELEGFENASINSIGLKERQLGGRLVFTDKNIYFVSSEKTMKIPYNKVLTYTPYKNALCLQKDGVSAKPQIFTGVDGWLIFNIVKNIKI